MDWTGEPSAGLEQDIERLERFLSARSDLSPDARVTGLAALVNAKAMLRGEQLAGALERFSDNAELLAATLGNLPGS
jgi:hypothetical protein